MKYLRYGSLPATAYTGDQRFSFYAHIPPTPSGTIAVLVHGSGRDAESMRAHFVNWADNTGTILLAPLFPAGILHPLEVDSYKPLAHGGLRYDEVLNGMINDIVDWVDVDLEPELLMFGFSGGAQFVHRYLLIHPDRVSAVSIGAPGAVTTIDPTRNWWVGTRDVEEIFGRSIDLDAIAGMPVQAIIGGDDDGRETINIPPDSPRWSPGVNDAGTTRRERLRTLATMLTKHGAEVEFVIVPDTTHEVAPMIANVQSFFSRVLGDSTATHQN